MNLAPFFHLISSSKQMENGSQIMYLNSDDRLDYDTTVCYLGVFLWENCLWENIAVLVFPNAKEAFYLPH